MAEKIKSIFYRVYKGIEDAQLRKAHSMIAEYKRTGYLGGWE